MGRRVKSYSCGKILGNVSYWIPEMAGKIWESHGAAKNKILGSLVQTFRQGQLTVVNRGKCSTFYWVF